MPTLETERLVPRIGSAWTATSVSASPLFAEHRPKDRMKSAMSRPVGPFSYTDRVGIVDRPRSTPARAASAGMHSPSDQTRPHTSVGEKENSQCSRVTQVYREPVRKHNLTSSLPVKRQKPQSAVSTTSSEGTPMCFQVGPGYIMYRSKSKIAVNINAEELWGKEEKKPEVVRFDRSSHRSSPRKVEEDYKDQLIAQLQEQVNDLKLFLEEEKLNHKDTIQRCAEELRARLQEMEAGHAAEMRAYKEKHRREVEEMKLLFEEELEKERKEGEELENKLRQDIDFLQASFESYKSALAVEVQDRLKEKEADLRREFELQMQKAMQEMRVAFNREKMIEKAEWQQEANREMDKLRRDHRKEMDSLARKFADAQALLEKLNETAEELNSLKRRTAIEEEKKNSELQILKEEHEFLKEEKARVVSQLKTLEAELEKTQTRLQQFQDTFEERVRRVDEQYRLKIEGLQRQSIDLRRAYMTKCEELVEEKTKNDVQILERLENSKDAMRSVIEARNRAAISIAALDDADERDKQPYLRPLSAPLTNPERRKAQDCAGESQNR